MLLLDAFIPGLSSPEMIRSIRTMYNESRLPIIVLTPREHVELIHETFRAGASDYLMKPVSRDDLSIRLRNTLLLRQIAQQKKRINVIEQDLGMARKIQLSTLPSRPPELPGLEIGLLYVPMEKVGGDFYNFHVTEEKNLGVLITDVSGHGIAAALISSMIKVTFSTLKEKARTPADFLTGLSRIMVEHLDEHFLTAGYAYIDVEDRVLHLARAGHEPTIVYHRSRQDVQDYLPKGAMISPVVRKPFAEIKVTLEPGDRVIFYTDCVTEIMNSEGKMYGKRRFNEFIRDTAGLSPEEVTSRLNVDLWSWTGGKDVFDDDLTVIVVDIT
jgi:two-component system sensor histidine kinase ChiS